MQSKTVRKKCSLLNLINLLLNLYFRHQYLYLLWWLCSCQCTVAVSKGLISFIKCFSMKKTKWRFSAKSAVFKCRIFPNTYFSNSISWFSAEIRLSRPADSGKRAGLTFFLKKGRAYFWLLKKGRAHFWLLKKGG